MKTQTLRKIDIYIFDMDGTLYQLDGVKNSYKNSSLESNILTNALKFIIKQESCSIKTAIKIRKKGLSNKTGLSLFLSDRYQIPRSKYFDEVWNINPEKIVNNFEIPVKILKNLFNNSKILILLTSAPKVWQENVFRYLQITNLFKEIYTCEDYNNKGEIFNKLNQKYKLKNIISIGDQEKTDIIPAIKIGLDTLLIKNTGDFVDLDKCI